MSKNSKTFLFKYKHSEVPLEQLNYLRIPVTCFANNIEGMNEFNKVYFEVLSLKLNKMVRTRSNGISISVNNIRNNMLSYSVKERSNGAGVELVVVIGVNAWRFQWRQTQRHKGHTNFLRFAKMCKNHNIDLSKYADKEGKETKAEIIPAPIKLEHEIYRDTWYKDGDVHHIDLNSSYPTGLMKSFPEFAPVIEYLYNKRKKNETYKDILNHTIGFFQSKYVGYRYSKLAKAAIDYNNKRIKELSDMIVKHGGIILLYNTDGIWYKGKLFDSKDKGHNLGQWHYDYKNVKEFHIKSAGCFEFIDENGEYVSKARGIQKELLHKMGDIDIVKGIRKFWFDKDKGICYED